MAWKSNIQKTSPPVKTSLNRKIRAADWKIRVQRVKKYVGDLEIQIFKKLVCFWLFSVP